MIVLATLTLQAPTKTVWDGVYTDEQAARGKDLVRNECERCHESSDFGGDTWLKRWSGQTAFDIFSDISSLMPMDSPGKLEKQQYADVIAYMFKANSFPSGAAELGPTPETLKDIKIQPKPGR